MNKQDIIKTCKIIADVIFIITFTIQLGLYITGHFDSGAAFSLGIIIGYAYGKAKYTNPIGNK